MKISQRGLDLLKKVEHFEAVPYDDRTGKAISAWNSSATVGYGHLITSEQEFNSMSYPMTEEEALDLLRADLRFAEDAADKVASLAAEPVSQNQFDALVMLGFNIGARALCTSSVARLMANPQARTPYPDLESAWKAWCRQKGAVVNGLVSRRSCEWLVFTAAVYKPW